MSKLWNYLWRSLVVGGGYGAGLALTNLLLSHDLAWRALAWRFAAGLAIALALGWLVAALPATSERQLLVWGSVIFFNLVSVTIEGRFFAPEHVQGSLVSLILQQGLVSLVTSWLLVRLFATPAIVPPERLVKRSWLSWVWRIAASALGYVVFYYFFGALNYLLVTGPYYQSHTGGLAVPSQGVILRAELIRGVLIVLSLLPYLLTTTTNRKRTALVSGLVLYAVGGLAPLLMQVGALPLFLLAASAVEIFLQNFSTGMVTAVLLG